MAFALARFAIAAGALPQPTYPTYPTYLTHPTCLTGDHGCAYCNSSRLELVVVLSQSKRLSHRNQRQFS